MPIKIEIKVYNILKNGEVFLFDSVAVAVDMIEIYRQKSRFVELILMLIIRERKLVYFLKVMTSYYVYAVSTS